MGSELWVGPVLDIGAPVMGAGVDAGRGVVAVKCKGVSLDV